METRREFLGHLSRTGAVVALATAGGGAILFEEGCNASNIFSTIMAWIPTAKIAFQGILTILGPFLPAGAQGLADAVFAAMDAVTAAVVEYNNAPAADKATALGKIKTVLKAVADNIQTFLSAFNVTGNPIIAVILGLAQIILSTIAGFLNNLPVTGAKIMTIRTTVTFGGVTKPVVPKLRDLKAFKHDFNAVADANGQSQIDLQ